MKFGVQLGANTSNLSCECRSLDGCVALHLLIISLRSPPTRSQGTSQSVPQESVTASAVDVNRSALHRSQCLRAVCALSAAALTYRSARTHHSTASHGFKSKIFSIFAGFFSTIFGENPSAFLFGKLRRSCPGPRRKLRRPLSHMISAGDTHVPRPGPRSKTQADLLTLEHGTATGPVNRETFQSAGPRAGLLKLETCTISVGASPDSF
jgi:hypothetical protein